ncbi:MAG TPA: TetR/AcrR family transcriptional regulator [Gemmatimonadales bacterium]|nr:TetR/AcrR family transcriptional regulator [Gemmatimonadales bacterium]
MAKRVGTKHRSPRGAHPARRPQQERGEKRVEEILDAAEAVIAEVGVEAATTNAIAERAAASVGSLYHFFPNKEAIVRALSARYEQILTGIKSASLSPDAAGLSVRAMVDGIVDPFARFMTERPAYLEVFHATQDPRQPWCLNQQFHQGIVDLVEGLMRARAPDVEPGYRRFQATFAVEYVHRMLEAAWAQPPAMRQAMIDELKRVFILHAEMIQQRRDPLAESA